MKDKTLVDLFWNIDVFVYSRVLEVGSLGVEHNQVGFGESSLILVTHLDFWEKHYCRSVTNISVQAEKYLQHVQNTYVEYMD